MLLYSSIMNLHFLSFLMDLASWVVFGLIYSRFVSKREKLSEKSSYIAYITITFFALLGGLIATIDRSLPEYGFAFYHFFISVVFAAVYSLRYVNGLRQYAARQVNYVTRILTFPTQKVLQK